MNTLAAGMRLNRPSEVRFGATVLSAPRFFSSPYTRLTHEAFDVRADDGQRVEIVDDVTIAPRIAVAPGDRVGIQGELVPHTRFGPLVHWTHHDPQGTHVGGFIDWRGRRYA